MSGPTLISWSRMARWRNECYERFGSILDLPIVRSPYLDFQRLLREDSRILDVGAGVDKPLYRRIMQSEAFTPQYFALDVDPLGEFDYRSFDDIPDEQLFDLIWANQVLEHVPLAEAITMVGAAYRHLVYGGYFLATVPNTAHPVRQRDSTHVTAWPMFDIYSLFRDAGFEVYKMARYNKHRFPINPVKRMVTNIVCEVFRVDWCDSLMIIGQKRESAS